VALCFFVLLPCLAQETVTITTYYPAPYGLYRDLRTDWLAVGSAYRNSNMTDGNMIITGRLGIGTQTLSDNATRLSIYRAGTTQVIISSGGDAANTTLYLANTGGGTTPSAWITLVGASGSGGAGAGSLNFRAGGPIAFHSGNVTNVLVATKNVSNSARVGIATNTPLSTLDVRGRSNVCVKVYYNNNTGTTCCPRGTYIVNQEGPECPGLLNQGYFVCCRACPYDDTNGNGICDE
jgi:hypothetical protein